MITRSKTSWLLNPQEIISQRDDFYIKNPDNTDKFGGLAMNPEAFNLTLEQQLQMRLIEESAKSMSREQMQELIVQVSRLLMMKDNVIRNLIKMPLPQSMG
jgi:uncharacterized protein YaaW (UPF0174 family)